MTIGINTSPLAGADGTKLTARQVLGRLEAELVGNVSLRVNPTERPDTWEVQGRGELQLAVLVETMRREGFELTVGKPQVVTREIDGKLHEPMERVAIDVPDDYLGVVTQLMALRKGTLIEMVNHGTGWVRMDYRVPARGLVGFRTEFMTETRGTGMLHHVFDGWEPWHGELKTRRNGSMVADRRGVTTGYTLMSLQERGILLVGPGTEVYEGMVVGRERPRRGDGRQPHQGEEADQHPVRRRPTRPIRLTPPLLLSLEQALEFIADDECVEVTPKAVRLRKVVLDQATRGRQRSRARKAELNRAPTGRPTGRTGPGGSEGRARTSNIWLQRPAFCQLNYLGSDRSAGRRAPATRCPRRTVRPGSYPAPRGPARRRPCHGSRHDPDRLPTRCESSSSMTIRRSAAPSTGPSASRATR